MGALGLAESVLSFAGRCLRLEVRTHKAPLEYERRLGGEFAINPYIWGREGGNEGQLTQKLQTGVEGEGGYNASHPQEGDAIMHFV